MDVASTLLFVESSVDGMGSGRAVSAGDDTVDEHLAKSEMNSVADVVLQEAISDLGRGKDAIVNYIDSEYDAALLGDVPQWFNQVKGGLLLLGDTRAAALINAAGRYVDLELVKRAKQPPQQELDSLADAICGLEYYLESRKDNRMYIGSAMNVAEDGLEKLGYPAESNDTPDQTGQELERDSATEKTITSDQKLEFETGHNEAPAGAMDDPLQKAGMIVEPAESDECPQLDSAKDDTEFPDDAKSCNAESCDEVYELEAEPADCVDGVPAAVRGIGPTDAAMSQAAIVESDSQRESANEPTPVAHDEITESTDNGKDEQGEEQKDEAVDVIGEDVDDEILEIFIEEAEEEIQSIKEQLPAWLSSEDNTDALGTVRRSFHTLKGSGRLVGAMRIGEFAWAYENMLNRVIDGSIAVSDEMRELLHVSMNALPELVSQIKDGTRVTQAISHLMQCADALSMGESLPSQGEEKGVQGSNAHIDPEMRLDSTVLPIDECAEELEEERGDKGGANEDADDDISVAGVMDPMLYEIFNSETRGHLEVIRQFLGRVSGGDASVDDALGRAIHTMHGSAHMAKADAIARLAGELERYVKVLQVAEQNMCDDGCALLEESAGLIESMLERLPGMMMEPEGLDAVIAKAHSLTETVHTDQRAETTESGTTDALDADEGDSQLEVQKDSSVGSSPDMVEPAREADVEPESDVYEGCDQELLDIFLEESEDNLETIESALDRWRLSPDDTEALAALQRGLHTLKGGARMADLMAIGDLAHAVESLVIAIDEGKAGVNEAAFHCVQQAQDRLVSMLESVRHRRPVTSANELIAELEALRNIQDSDAGLHIAGEQEEFAGSAHEVGQESGEAPVVGGAPSTSPYSDTDPELLEVFVEEASDILEHSDETLQGWKKTPDDTALIAELQRELHTLKGGARMADITEIGDLAHAVESLMVKLAEGGVEKSSTIFIVLERAQDRLVSMVERVRRRESLNQDTDLIDDLRLLREGKQPAANAASAQRSEKLKTAETAAEPVTVKEGAEHAERRIKPRGSQELVRVRADLLDNMVNYAGEVSIYRSRLEQQVGAYRFNLVEMEQTVTRVREQLRKLEIETEAQVLFRYEKEAEHLEEDFDPLEMDRYSHMQQLSRSLMESVSDLSSIQGLLENITRESETLLLQQSRVNTELQEGLMRTRMVPFLGLAARMRRIVRQTAQELGKKAELELSGAEGEMDRTVVDRIVAPLEHMLRNALSHGIEPPEQRKGVGKPESGTIRITLERESSDVVLRIADDGAGISLNAIKKKAIERGLMTKDANLTDNEILQFILETGFSTAEKVTQVAGRGVGMDVVNSEVKQLGGSLRIDSVQGKGTTFTVRLPFTLALNQALLIEVGEDTYAIPLSSIEGIVRMRREDLRAYYDDPESRFDYGGYAYEVRHLGSVLGTGKPPHLDSGPKRYPALLARAGEHCVALQVENLLGSREIVVKSVGPQISTVRGVSGATILGDGRVVMILDVAALLRGGAAIGMESIDEIIHQPMRTAGLTVMVVDDSITVRKVTTRLLERNDMNVIAAKDGVDAVSKLQEHIPDIMLLDIEMPRMDGFELATHVRNEPRLRDIPIIMITSRTGDKHRQRAMQIGVNRYLGKPFQETDLLENIQALLEER
jgi:chemosensory pili system protein ChpA (sensor histidine kinase/response regulator)